MTTIMLRRGTSAEWTAANSVLAEGEPGFEIDTGKLKVGDGESVWSALPYFLAEPEIKAMLAASPGVEADPPVLPNATVLSLTSAEAHPFPPNSPTVMEIDYAMAPDENWQVDLSLSSVTVPYSGYYHVSIRALVTFSVGSEPTLWADTSSGRVRLLGGIQELDGASWLGGSEFVFLTANTILRPAISSPQAATYGGLSQAPGLTFSIAYFGGPKTDPVSQGDRIRQGSRELSPNNYVKLQSFHDSSRGMVIWAQKVADDSDDSNIDGGIVVKHGKAYEHTAGYADTLQVYTLAGSAGTVLGNNNFVELDRTRPYKIPFEWTPNGYIRFELGPYWPESEVCRFNNRGDMLIGFKRHTGLYSAFQSGDTVTSAVGMFEPASVGKYVAWVDASSTGVMDRIVEYITPNSVRVETLREQSTQRILVGTFRVEVRNDGTIISNSPGRGFQSRGQDGKMYRISPPNGGGPASWEPV